ncbi:MAG: hypothetical protein ACKPKO_34335, partial [Candidatus Fonsibacter sp.]
VGHNKFALKQLGRRRGHGFFGCVSGTDIANTEQVLYLFRCNNDEGGMQWVAVHGLPTASYDDVAKKKALPFFGTREKSIVEAGSHEQANTRKGTAN